MPFLPPVGVVMTHTKEIEYLVGEDKRLSDVLDDAAVLPLLKGAVKAGIGSAVIVDDQNVPLWTTGGEATPAIIGGEDPDADFRLMLEGEPVGAVRFKKGKVTDRVCRIMADVIGETLNTIMANNLKRMLTTEIHTRVVNLSYNELLDSNLKLKESEKKYRELAENLEIRVHERTNELKRVYSRLIQQEKMASVGQLAAGVAHEINNPIGYVLSNLNTLHKYVEKMTTMLAYYRSTGDTLAWDKWKRLKLDLVLGDVDALLEQSISGAERVAKIVSDLKGFSIVEGPGERVVDIHVEIERTLTVLAGEIPPEAKIIKQFGDLPGIAANGALLCQVFINVLRNAFQAKTVGLEVYIVTDFIEGAVRITISDNGPGVPDNIRGRIFEPFFTTRDVGQGTGLGLTVAYDIVTGYGGTITVKNRRQGGASFLIELPSTGSIHGQVR
jgi:C4-dicarboxylate-specific signal transduction histidine kinase